MSDATWEPWRVESPTTPFFPRHFPANNMQNSLSLERRDLSTMAFQINGSLTAGFTARPDNNKWNLKDPHYWDILVRIFRLSLAGSSNCSMSFRNIMVQHIHSLFLYPSFSIKCNSDIMHIHYIFSDILFSTLLLNIATEWRLIQSCFCLGMVFWATIYICGAV